MGAAGEDEQDEDGEAVHSAVCRFPRFTGWAEGATAAGTLTSGVAGVMGNAGKPVNGFGSTVGTRMVGPIIAGENSPQP